METNSQIGVGIVGAGVVGRMRAAAVSKHPRFRLVAVADVDAQNVQRAIEGTSARGLADYRHVIDTPGVDVVVVSTPGHLHVDMAVDALGAGKHVLCEKPLAIDPVSCRRIVDAAAQAKRTLAVGFNHRYFPAFRALKDHLDAGGIGEVDHARAMAGHPGLGEFRAEWMYRREWSGGGAMMDIGIHLTDMIRFALGPIVEVSAVCSNRVWQVAGSEDNAMALMRAGADVPVRYHATWSEWKGYRMSLEVYGSRGMVGAYYAPMANLIVTTDGRPGGARRRRLDLHPRVNVREKVRGWETTAELAFGDELGDFAGLIEGRPGRIADGAAGLAAVAVAQAAYDSSAAGAPVRVQT